MSAQRIIPPDPEGMNDQRAQWAAFALQAFLIACPGDEDCALADLLCDLRHWADRAGVDFGKVLYGAMGCYLEEITPWPDDEAIEHDQAESLTVVPYLTRF